MNISKISDHPRDCFYHGYSPVETFASDGVVLLEEEFCDRGLLKAVDDYGLIPIRYPLQDHYVGEVIG